jgi:hypothetical protein
VSGKKYDTLSVANTLNFTTRFNGIFLLSEFSCCQVSDGNAVAVKCRPADGFVSTRHVGRNEITAAILNVTTTR